ncbi:MAG: hypothetical protein ABN478_05050 [Mixta sp.]|uniref:hypothetical protein n=1 Tax=Mixta sp. Marseille-Q2659 TaxID=2736607 RepID=UPI0023BA353C|nr:hypothetical protein [Mixta sp. Marseille-Q2659]
MNDKKMISIDQFNADERVAIDETFKGLVQKYRLRTGKEPDAKKEKEFTAEARQMMMVIKQNNEKEKERAAKKPVRKKKPSTLKASEVSDFNWSASVQRGKR